MDNVQRAFTCLALLALASCATIDGGQETLWSLGPVAQEIMASMYVGHPDIRYQGTWKYGYSKEVKGEYAIDEFVPKSESIENWTKLYTQQNLRRSRSSLASPKAMMTGLKDLMEKRCPRVVWNIIREGDTDIVYEYHFADCDGHPAQQEIARILYGKWNIWRIAYTQKGAPMDEQERLKWIETLSEPRIVLK